MLDKIGLTKKDSEGYRVRTDNGQRLRIEQAKRRLEQTDEPVEDAPDFAGNALLKARAVENTVWVVAADTRSDNTIGHSAIVDPLAIPVASLEEEGEAVTTADVTRERIDEVRSFLPVLANRRTDVLG